MHCPSLTILVLYIMQMSKRLLNPRIQNKLGKVNAYYTFEWSANAYDLSI